MAIWCTGNPSSSYEPSTAVLARMPLSDVKVFANNIFLLLLCNWIICTHVAQISLQWWCPIPIHRVIVYWLWWSPIPILHACLLTLMLMYYCLINPIVGLWLGPIPILHDCLLSVCPQWSESHSHTNDCLLNNKLMYTCLYMHMHMHMYMCMCMYMEPPSCTSLLFTQL